LPLIDTQTDKTAKNHALTFHVLCVYKEIQKFKAGGARQQQRSDRQPPKTAV